MRVSDFHERAFGIAGFTTRTRGRNMGSWRRGRRVSAFANLAMAKQQLKREFVAASAGGAAVGGGGRW